MAITNVFKRVNDNQINCDESVEVTLGFTAAPDISSNPADIVLILDRSGSLTGNPLAALKEGAKTFIDVIYGNTGGTNGQIVGGTRIGIVSFSDNATTDAPLSTDIAMLKSEVDSLVANGRKNQEAGFIAANNLFDFSLIKDKIIVLFTDGVWNEGNDPIGVATDLKAAPKNT